MIVINSWDTALFISAHSHTLETRPQRVHSPPNKSKKSPLFWILMCVTSSPRRTDSVNAPGLDDDRRAKNEPSKPRFSSRSSASCPVIDGWNHLQ